jgi:hypothetical protein
MPAGVLSPRNLRSSTELKPENLSMWISAEAPSPSSRLQRNFKQQYPKPDLTIALRLYLDVGSWDLELSAAKGPPGVALRNRQPVRELSIANRVASDRVQLGKVSCRVVVPR